jgi:hypothetical protein
MAGREIKVGGDYYALCIEDHKSWGTYKDRVRIRKEWLSRIRERFPKFDSQKHRSLGLAKMAAGKIKQVFPDAPIEILPMCDVCF